MNKTGCKAFPGKGGKKEKKKGVLGCQDKVYVHKAKLRVVFCSKKVMKSAKLWTKI